MFHIFVSYSHKQKSFVENTLGPFLENLDFKVWWDQSGIDDGDDWWSEITEAIEKSFAFVILVSEDSMKSKVVAREILEAKKLNKFIIPIMYGDSLSIDILPHNLADLHFGCFVKIDGEHDKEYITFESVPRLIKSLREKRGPKFLNDALHSLHSSDWGFNLQRIIDAKRPDYLNHILDSPDYADEVKTKIIISFKIAGVGDKDSIPHILSAVREVKDGQLSIVQRDVEAALRGLNMINDPSAIPALNEMSTNLELKLITRSQIIKCLGEFKDISSLPFIESIMREADQLITTNNGSRTITSPAGEVYSACLDALARIGETYAEAVPLLLSTLDTYPTTWVIGTLDRLLRLYDKAEYKRLFVEKLISMVERNIHKDDALRELRQLDIFEAKTFIEDFDSISE